MSKKLLIEKLLRIYQIHSQVHKNNLLAHVPNFRPQQMLFMRSWLQNWSQRDDARLLLAKTFELQKHPTLKFYIFGKKKIACKFQTKYL